MKINTKATDKTHIMFGKYKGTPLGEVPADYLLWLYEQPNFEKTRPEIYNYIKSGLEWLKKEAKNHYRKE